MRSVLRDLGEQCELRLSLDSSAAIGICRRTGVGRVRHLDTRLLWIQELVRDGQLHVVKVAGTSNPADLMTKFLGADGIFEHTQRLGCAVREGRAQSAPKCALGLYRAGLRRLETKGSEPRRGVRAPAGTPGKVLQS